MAPHRWPRSGEGFSHFFHNCWAHAPMAHTNAPRALRAFGASGARGRVSCGKVRKVLPGPSPTSAASLPSTSGGRVEGGRVVGSPGVGAEKLAEFSIWCPIRPLGSGRSVRGHRVVPDSLVRAAVEERAGVLYLQDG